MRIALLVLVLTACSGTLGDDEDPTSTPYTYDDEPPPVAYFPNVLYTSIAVGYGGVTEACSNEELMAYYGDYFAGHPNEMCQERGFDHGEFRRLTGRLRTNSFGQLVCRWTVDLYCTQG